MRHRTEGGVGAVPGLILGVLDVCDMAWHCWWHGRFEIMLVEYFVVIAVTFLRLSFFAFTGVPMLAIYHEMLTTTFFVPEK